LRVWKNSVTVWGSMVVGTVCRSRWRTKVRKVRRQSYDELQNDLNMRQY